MSLAMDKMSEQSRSMVVQNSGAVTLLSDISLKGEVFRENSWREAALQMVGDVLWEIMSDAQVEQLGRDGCHIFCSIDSEKRHTRSSVMGTFFCSESIHNRRRRRFLVSSLTLSKDAESSAFVERFISLLRSSANRNATDESKIFPPIYRGFGEHDPYLSTVDNLFVEYDFDRLLFKKVSEYQDVKIYHSRQFGGVLVLDDDPNLAESDYAYTSAITGFGAIDYGNKDVLVLGGGDGGVLNHLLTRVVPAPRSVTMIEIDRVVIDACRKYLRGVCGSSLDALSGVAPSGTDYQVLIEDCIPYLRMYGDQGRQFDVIVNDLTAVPICPEMENVGGSVLTLIDEKSLAVWNFLETVLKLSLAILRVDGHYFTQGNSVNAKTALQRLESCLEQRFNPSVSYTRTDVCIPSYHELWAFYCIKFKEQQDVYGDS